MLGKVLRVVGRVHLVLLALAMSVVLCEPHSRRYGDQLQLALPLIAWGCAALDRSATEFAARFTGLLIVTHTSKAALGDAAINQRPGGGDKGFPSAHTAAAAFGASSLVHDCISAHPTAKAVTVVAAAFVGASRIEARKHDIWQVLAGGLLGLAADRGLRGAALRRAIGRRLEPVRAAALRALRSASAAVLARARILMVLLVPLAALAGSAGLARSEIELSAYGGGQSARSSLVEDTVLGTALVSWSGKSLDSPPYYGLRATWWKNETWGFGAEINHAKIYADRPASHGYDVLEFTDGLNLLTANVFRRFPNQGRVTPYIGGGLGVAIPHVEIQRAGEGRTFSYQLTGPAAIFVAGASVRIGGRWSAFSEVKASYSRNRASVDAGGSLSTDIVTHAINLGLTVSF